MDTQNFVTLPREVVEQLKHSIKQARIPGNDWRRELALIENTLTKLTEQVQPAQGEWHHCSPELLASGVDCATTKRRDCECEIDGSHDHFINARPQSNAERVPLSGEKLKELWVNVCGTAAGYGPFARAIEAAHGITKGQQ